MDDKYEITGLKQDAVLEAVLMSFPTLGPRREEEDGY
jgi:hypothetical protein